jgi:hypothetical protein
MGAKTQRIHILQVVASLDGGFERRSKNQSAH